MSANKTQNFGLHVWEAGDDFLRSEFNENFAAIDDAVAGRAVVTAGAYSGNQVNGRVVELPFTPRAVMVETRSAHRVGGSVYGALAVRGFQVGTGSSCAMEIVEKGFRLYHDGGGCLNESGYVYYYMALM